MSSQEDPLWGVDPSKLHGLSRRNLLVRFAFGALISLVSGAVGAVWGPLAGGLLLAFPAILPATLTLIEEESGEGAARDDDDGAALGAVALVAFALVGWLVMPAGGAPLALTAAGIGWLVVAVASYLVSRLPGRLRR